MKKPRKQEDPGKPRLFGLAGVLSQSEAVSRAFGPEKGFYLMLATIAAATAVSLGSVIILARGVGKFFG